MALLFSNGAVPVPQRLFLYDANYAVIGDDKYFVVGRPIRFKTFDKNWSYTVIASSAASSYSGTVEDADANTFTPAVPVPDNYAGCVLIITSGVAVGSVVWLAGWDGSQAILGMAWPGVIPAHGDTCEIVPTWELYGDAADNDWREIEYGDFSKLVQKDLFTYGNVGGAHTHERHYLTTSERSMWYGPPATLVAAYTRLNLGPQLSPATHSISTNGIMVAVPVAMSSADETNLWWANPNPNYCRVVSGTRLDVHVEDVEAGGGTNASALSTRMLFVIEDPDEEPTIILPE
jgi:hypothetical protein